jgi:hypothetical protein
VLVRWEGLVAFHCRAGLRSSDVGLIDWVLSVIADLNN